MNIVSVLYLQVLDPWIQSTVDWNFSFGWIYGCTSLVAQMVKHLPIMRETQVQSLGREDPLEKETATHSSTLAWKTPGTEQRGRLHFSSVQLLCRVQLFVTPWTTVHQASLSITNSQSLSKLMSIELVMPSSHLILCHPLLLLPSVFPNIRGFSNESALHIRWPKYWSCSFNISPSSEHPGLISFRMDWLDLLAVQGTLESLL